MAQQTEVQQYLNHWESLQAVMRELASPLRDPEFDFALLSTGHPPEVKSITKLPQRLVLVLGGLQGSRASAERFAEALHKQCGQPERTAFGLFVYPNDGSIQASGTALGHLLRYIHQQAPQTQVSIVAHSMGGLVARSCLEGGQPTKLPVDQLIMICPPNHGSVLAQYADALEFSDAVSRLNSGNERVLSVFKSLINDGLGEACDELVPGSGFLRQLNARPRAAGVRYCIIAGTRGPIPPVVRLATAIAVDEGFQRTRIGELPNASELLMRANELITSDEFARGFGDGAVSVASTRLSGVLETAELPIHHAEWADLDEPQVQSLLKLVTYWLGRR
jgi:pimeloyl-ACP methyl ester carboxylesterase